MVKAGQRLVTLDGRADAARAEQAASLVAQIDAQLKDAERNLERSKTLRQQGFVSASAVDAAQATVDVLRATRAAGEANTEASRVALSYQTLNASLTGRIGAVDVHEGSLVTPSATQPILTITQLDPIGLRFSLPQSELPRLMQAQTAGKIPVYATLDHGKTLAGVLTFVDSQVDSANGSIALKAEFGNPDHVLWPGMFTRVTVELGVSRQAIIVPSGAVQTGPNGQFVYVVQQDQTVKPQPVRLIRIFTREGKQFAVLDGVADGIKLVAEGGQNLRPGSKIVEAGKGKETAAKPSKDGRGNDKASANLTH